MLQVVDPPPDLGADVEAGIVVRRPAGESRFPAMPRAMLTLPLDAGWPAAVTFHALSTRPSVQRHGAPVAALGLVLLPAAAARLLGASTGALVDQVLPWAEVAGSAEARRLADELALAAHPAARLQALQHSLRRTLARGPARVQAARADALQQLCLAVGAHGARAAPLLGLSERQLQRRCMALLALSPKRLQRLVRFQAALRGAVRASRLPGAEAALDAGFFDQSHLAREVRQLAGQPLRQVLAGAHDGGTWWPLQAQRLPLRHHR